jgi:hypothetical protein
MTNQESTKELKIGDVVEYVEVNRDRLLDMYYNRPGKVTQLLPKDLVSVKYDNGDCLVTYIDHLTLVDQKTDDTVILPVGNQIILTDADKPQATEQELIELLHEVNQARNAPCECGMDHIGGYGHSTWCPKFEKMGD